MDLNSDSARLVINIRRGVHHPQQLVQRSGDLAVVFAPFAAQFGLQRANFAGQLQRQLDTGQIDSTFLNQGLDLAESVDVLAGLQTKIAGRPRRRDKTFALVLAQSLRMQLQEP